MHPHPSSIARLRFAATVAALTVAAGGGDDRVAARDGSIDDIACGRGEDRVRLDKFDAIGLGCERIARKGKPRAVITGELSLFGSADDPELSGGAACPYDFGTVCRTRLAVFKDGKLIGSGRDRVHRTSDVEQTVSAKLNARGRRLLQSLDGGRTQIRARLTTVLPSGRVRRSVTTETLVDDL